MKLLLLLPILLLLNLRIVFNQIGYWRWPNNFTRFRGQSLADRRHGLILRIIYLLQVHDAEVRDGMAAAQVHLRRWLRLMVDDA